VTIDNDPGSDRQPPASLSRLARPGHPRRARPRQGPRRRRRLDRQALRPGPRRPRPRRARPGHPGHANDKPLEDLVDRARGSNEATWKMPSAFPPEPGPVQGHRPRRGTRPVEATANYELLPPLRAQGRRRLRHPQPHPADGRHRARLDLDVRDAVGLPSRAPSCASSPSRDRRRGLRDRGRLRVHPGRPAGRPLAGGQRRRLRQPTSPRPSPSRSGWIPAALLAWPARAGPVRPQYLQAGWPRRAGLDAWAPLQIAGQYLRMGLSAPGLRLQVPLRRRRHPLPR